jgi:hypothetical protein
MGVRLSGIMADGKLQETNTSIDKTTLDGLMFMCKFPDERSSLF